MDPYVRTMHERSGLLQELDAGITLGEAEAHVLAYIREHCAEGSRPPLAGNTVATDRSFLVRDMPTLESFLHYRIVDVSSIKELSRRWFPRAYFHAPAKRGNHRALADIQESIEELRYYREAVFVAPPGPDSETVKELATKHGGALTGLRRRRPTRPTPRIPTTSRSPSRISSGPGCPPGPHGGCSSAGRAPRCGRGCRGFKSRHSPQAFAAPPCSFGACPSCAAAPRNAHALRRWGKRLMSRTPLLPDAGAPSSTQRRRRA